MATPTHCTIYDVEAHFFPWNDELRRPEIDARSSASTRGPNGARAPARSGPSTRASCAGTSKPVAGAFCDFTLKLDRDDGDQFLGDLNFTMPPGLHRRPARHRLLPGGRDRGRGRSNAGTHRAGRARAARPRARSARPTSPPARAPTRSTRWARCIWPGRSRARRSRWRRSPPRSPGPTTTASWSSGSRFTSIPSTAQVFAASDTVPEIIGGIPIRMRSIQVNIDKPELHDQPDQLLALLGRLPGDRRPGHGHRLLLLLPGGQLRQPAASSRR